MVLESSAFRVWQPAPSPSHCRVIADAQTGEIVGRARWRVGRVATILRRLTGYQLLPLRVEVRETLDDSLLFVLRRRLFRFRFRMDVLDSFGERVGFLIGRPNKAECRIRMHDRAGSC